MLFETFRWKAAHGLPSVGCGEMIEASGGVCTPFWEQPGHER